MDYISNKITHDILKECVSTEHGILADEISIENVNISGGSKKGDGYACEIAAISFDAIFAGQTLAKNYIAKYSGEGAKAEMLREGQAFEREVVVYQWLIPKLQKLRSEKNLKPLAFAKCFYASNEKEIIIMENLKLQNFKVIDKKPESLTLKGFKLVLDEMASFHATGIHLMKTYPGGEAELTKQYPVIFPKDFPLSIKMIKDVMVDIGSKMFGCIIGVVEKYGSKELADRMIAFQPKVAESVAKVFDQEWKLYFITHGDAWLNNFLYRFPNDDQNNPSDLTIVDLQGTQLGQVGVELNYMIHSCTSPQQRKEHLPSLLRHYYDKLCKELHDMSGDATPPFTFDFLIEQFEACYPYGFVMGCIHTQALLFDENSTVNFKFEDMSDEAAAKQMVGDLQGAILQRATSDPDYRKIIIGLAEEGLRKKLI